MVSLYNEIGRSATMNYLAVQEKNKGWNLLFYGEVVVEYKKYSDEGAKLRNCGKWSDSPDFGKYDEGHISLQNHGTKLWYRNIKIEEL